MELSLNGIRPHLFLVFGLLFLSSTLNAADISIDFPLGSSQPRSGWSVKSDFVRHLTDDGTVDIRNGVWVLKDVKFYYVDRLGQKHSQQVFSSIALVEIFVPYDDGSGSLEMSGGGMGPVQTKACWGSPAALRIPKHYEPYVIEEVLDDGVRFLRSGDAKPRRGQKLRLWTVWKLDAYYYIVEFNFCDDGTIVARVGATGRNIPWKGTGDAHFHLACWRIEPALIPLGSPKRDSAANRIKRITHVQLPGGKAEVRSIPFNRGFEGGMAWNHSEFTVLQIESGKLFPVKNRPAAYDLVPQASGRLTTTGFGEGFTANDLWVTRKYDWDKDSDYVEFEYHRLPSYVTPAERIDNEEVVIWHQAAINHVPRNEDFGELSGGERVPAGTVAMWSSFQLRPRNLFPHFPFLE